MEQELEFVNWSKLDFDPWLQYGVSMEKGAGGLGEPYIFAHEMISPPQQGSGTRDDCQFWVSREF